MANTNETTNQDSTTATRIVKPRNYDELTGVLELTELNLLRKARLFNALREAVDRGASEDVALAADEVANQLALESNVYSDQCYELEVSRDADS